METYVSHMVVDAVADVKTEFATEGASRFSFMGWLNCALEVDDDDDTGR
jgi:hypothetical protein